MSNEADIATVKTIKSQTLAIIADLTENPKPSYDIDGQEVLWGDYLKQLQETVAWCNSQLAADESYIIVSRGLV